MVGTGEVVETGLYVGVGAVEVAVTVIVTEGDVMITVPVGVTGSVVARGLVDPDEIVAVATAGTLCTLPLWVVGVNASFVCACRTSNAEMPAGNIPEDGCENDPIMKKARITMARNAAMYLTAGLDAIPLHV